MVAPAIFIYIVAYALGQGGGSGRVVVGFVASIRGNIITVDYDTSFSGLLNRILLFLCVECGIVRVRVRIELLVQDLGNCPRRRTGSCRAMLRRREIRHGH